MKFIEKIRYLFQEIKSFYIFYRQLDKKERDIVFYAEDEASYIYFEGLIDHLIEQEGLKVIYITSDIADPIPTLKKENLKALYIKSLLPLFTVSLNSKLLIMTMPDLHRFHIRRSERGTHHVYL
ncbi:MAG: hypothetical protein HQ579_08160, partial [Candidatus Omnitrophica bacterium]|nr:hypothetical protein [Candidatus Omnitrophota bacterium]